MVGVAGPRRADRGILRLRFDTRVALILLAAVRVSKLTDFETFGGPYYWQTIGFDLDGPISRTGIPHKARDQNTPIPDLCRMRDL